MSNNNNKSNSTASNGIGFFGLLTIAFIVLKLTGYINWEWVWVLAPMWMPAAIIISIAVIIWIVRFFVKKRFICLFKGHDYQGKYERRSLSYGYVDEYVIRCTRCGKRK